MNTNPNLAAERHFSLSRRHFLRGLGACVALPTFESLGALKALAAPANKLATTASGAPLRTAFVYFPNGAIPAAWWPKGESKDYEFSRTLKPLEPVRQHRDRPVMLRPRHPPPRMLARHHPPLRIDGIAVGVPTGLAEHRNRLVGLVEAQHPVVRTVRPH